MNIKRYKRKIVGLNVKDNGGVSMKKATSVYKPLDNKKKDILKSLAGSASTKIDLNKVRDEWKYGNN